MMKFFRKKKKWSTLKAQLKEKYTALTDEDLVYERGKEDRLISNIQIKTGETRGTVIQLLKGI